eukprot:COSAG01_NODE_2462_length_7649_cov_5.657616_5_plen_54_part_00
MSDTALPVVPVIEWLLVLASALLLGGAAERLSDSAAARRAAGCRQAQLYEYRY